MNYISLVMRCLLYVDDSYVFFFKQKTAYEMRISDWSSDVCSSDLQRNNIHLAACATGEVDATLKALRDSPKTASAKAKFILATDGETLQAEDVTSDDPPIACEDRKSTRLNSSH